MFYVLVVYPLWLAVWARRRARPVGKRPVRYSVSILLPVWNGEQWLREKLESILQLDYPRELLQTLVISDGSTDRTEETATEFASSGVELISIPHGGKGVALNEDISRAPADTDCCVPRALAFRTPAVVSSLRPPLLAS